MIVSRSKRMKFDDPVHIKVGTGKSSRSFMVHGSVLTSRSLFFRKALSGAWKEAEERIIKLPEDDSNTFELYLQCIYGQKVGIVPDPVPKDYRGHEERNALAKLYVFSEKVQDIRTKNVTLKLFLASTWERRSNGTCCVPRGASVQIIYEGTAAGSPMRRLLVDIFAYAITHTEAFQNFPRDFLAELATEMTKTRLNGSFKDMHHLKIKDSVDKYLEKEEIED